MCRCDDCINGVDQFGPEPDFLPNDDGLDTDGDGACNFGDDDDDNDGVKDWNDNCQTVYNPYQEDIDEDGLGNVCDTNGCTNCNALTPFGPCMHSGTANFACLGYHFGTTCHHGYIKCNQVSGPIDPIITSHPPYPPPVPPPVRAPVSAPSAPAPVMVPEEPPEPSLVSCTGCQFGTGPCKRTSWGLTFCESAEGSLCGVGATPCLS